MGAVLEFHATCHQDEMKIEVTINEVQEDGSIREVRRGVLENEDAVEAIIDLAHIKLLLHEDSKVT